MVANNKATMLYNASSSMSDYKDNSYKEKK